MEQEAITQEIKDLAADLVDKFDQAWNGRDAEALAPLFTEEADFQFYYGHLVRGRERIIRYYRDKVFPYLPEGLRHVTRSYKIRLITDEVLIGDGRVDLASFEDEKEKDVQRRLKVTTVVLKKGNGLKFSAVRVMVPVKDP